MHNRITENELARLNIPIRDHTRSIVARSKKVCITFIIYEMDPDTGRIWNTDTETDTHTHTQPLSQIYKIYSSIYILFITLGSMVNTCDVYALP